MKGLTKQRIKIFSDIQAVLKPLTKHKITSKSIYGCVQALKQVARENAVQLIWIPGHKGFKGNEKADELAKKSACLYQVN